MNVPLRSGEARRLPGALRREALVLAVALAFGLFAMPPLVWLAGTRAFGAYADGGPKALIVNFFHGLAAGSVGFWAVAVGPYVISLVARLLVSLVRGVAAAD